MRPGNWIKLKSVITSVHIFSAHFSTQAITAATNWPASASVQHGYQLEHLCRRSLSSHELAQTWKREWVINLFRQRLPKGLSSYLMNNCTFNLSLWWRTMRCLVQSSLESCQQDKIHLSTVVVSSTFQLCTNCPSFPIMLTTAFLCLGTLPKLKSLHSRYFLRLHFWGTKVKRIGYRCGPTKNVLKREFCN